MTEELRAAFAGMPRPPQRPPIVGYRLCIAKEDGTVENRDFSSRRTANKVARTLDEDNFRIERIYEAS
jgi:hypothetical protein